MKLVRIFASVLLAIVVILGLQSTAKAAPINPEKCEVFSRSFVIGESTIIANFEVRNIVDGVVCSKQVSVASWNAPNGIDGVPLTAQTIVDFTTGVYGVGIHTASVAKPKCFYQADLLRGADQYGATPGVPDYTAQQFVASAHGGQECVAVPPEKPQPPQKIVKVKRVTKVKVVRVPEPAKAEEQPQQIPKTGAGEAISLAGLTGVGSLVGHQVYSRRKLKK